MSSDDVLQALRGVAKLLHHRLLDVLYTQLLPTPIWVGSCLFGQISSWLFVPVFKVARAARLIEIRISR